MKTILVPLDGSALAEQALPYVRMFASLLGAGVRLLRVLPEPPVPHLVRDDMLQYAIGAPSELAPPLLEIDHQWYNAATYLDTQALRLRAWGLTVDTVVQCGPVAELIAAHAASPGTLIALATHGRNGLRRWALGSVAEQLLQCAPCPILIVRGGPALAVPSTIRRVMVPLDGSRMSRSALNPALTLCERAGAELKLFAAVAPYVGPYVDSATLVFSNTEELRDLALAELHDLADCLKTPGLTITSDATIGDPSAEIVAAAARHHADLIVMATHGRGGLGRWVLGSVADQVLHATTTPLLVVRQTA